MSGHVERTYRKFISSRNLCSFSVKISETDLYILADSDLSDLAFQSALRCRVQIEEYIRLHPEFSASLVPISHDEYAPEIIRDMLKASREAEVGPMASVAGAIAEHVGRDLLRRSLNVVVENGGDLFIHIKEDSISVGILSGDSPLTGKIALNIDASESPLGLCTSSGTVGHSLSFGSADAVCIKAKTASLADAAATSVGNLIKKKSDVKKGLERAMSIKGVLGVLIVIGDTMAIQGLMTLKKP